MPAKLTTLEREALQALIDESASTDHDFGLVEDVVWGGSRKALGGLITILQVKGLVQEVCEVRTDRLYHQYVLSPEAIAMDGQLVVQAQMLTLEVAKGLSYCATLYHVSHRNADGTALRARVNGKARTWKTMPWRVVLPLKYGLKQCFSITEKELEDWSLVDPTQVPNNEGR